jgi:fructose-bisphosphate aldolase, class I
MAAGGKGILAADESTSTITKRFKEIGIESTVENRRRYRTTIFAAPGLDKSISSVILYDETIRQTMDDGTPIPAFLSRRGIIVGIKVDRGLVPLAPGDKEQVTEGLDGLTGRLAEYRAMGAQFAKWRAVFRIGSGTPTDLSIHLNAWLLGRYARICQDGGLVPIVEPEVLMEGSHPIRVSREATRHALFGVFNECREHGVAFDQMVLKPNMVTPGADVFDSASAATIAAETVATLRECVPAAVPSITFLSGGQSEEQATRNLAEIVKLGPHPWQISFSFGRALQSSAMRAWASAPDSKATAQEALIARASANSSAARSVSE